MDAMSPSNPDTRGLLPSPGRYADLPPRCLMDRREALRDLRRPAIPLQLRATVYAFGADSFIVCATTSIAETGDVIRLPASVSNEALGLAALDQLLQCCAHPMPNLTEVKATTWPAFIASGAKTVRAFEQASTSVSIETAGMGIAVEGRRHAPRSQMYVGRTQPITGDPEELGEAVRAVVTTVRLLDSQDALF